MSRGIEFNNPFDLEFVPQTVPWIGQTGRDGDLLIFDTIENGLRAGFKDIKNAVVRDGFNTLNKFAAHYAPPDENDTAAYVRGLASTTGSGPDDVLILDEPEELINLAHAVLIQEQGADYAVTLTEEQLERAASEALA